MLLTFKYFPKRHSFRSLSISTSVNEEGFFVIMVSVNFPLPGPISKVFKFSEGISLQFYLLYYYQLKNFDRIFF